jgi:lipoyl(octanoyl) transferase
MDVYHLHLGLTGYKDAWDLQKQIHLFKQQNKASDVIITVEHPPVYTLGKTGDRNHILISDDEMASRGISYHEIDRGGDITYHGPGQLVVYPIFDLNNYYKDTHRYLRELEEVVILTLNDFGIKSGREEEFTGVWVEGEKICAIGIKVSRWITMHGLALNVNNDLSYFDKIIPCGIFHKGVTSMSKVKNENIDIKDLTKSLMENFKSIFKIKTITSVKQDDIDDLLVKKEAAKV